MLQILCTNQVKASVNHSLDHFLLTHTHQHNLAYAATNKLYHPRRELRDLITLVVQSPALRVLDLYLLYTFDDTFVIVYCIRELVYRC